jgi:hypothetical protein
MIYGSNRIWGNKKTDMQHRLKRAWSADGINWNRNYDDFIGLTDEICAISRPSLSFVRNCFYLMASIKDASGKYKLSLWRGRELDNLKRIDLEIRGTTKWPQESYEYPALLEIDGKLAALFNGNGYGRTGFGLMVEV